MKHVMLDLLFFFRKNLKAPDFSGAIFVAATSITKERCINRLSSSEHKTSSVMLAVSGDRLLLKLIE